MSDGSMVHRFREHGGNLSIARAHFPDAPEPWIDLSTGISPVPYPIPALPGSVWQRLPEADSVLALRKAAATAYGSLADCIVAAPGTQALINLLPRLIPAATVQILGPTYGEHAKAWAASDAAVEMVGTLEEMAGADVAVVVNPNNPDGFGIVPDALRALAARVDVLVVDEAFVDLVPDLALVPGGLPSNAIVLRSFGKTYGLAGLRLGFAVASPMLAGRIAEALGPWAVSGPAVEIGCRALLDRDWLRETAVRLSADVVRLDTMLKEAGLLVVGGTPLFRLADGGDAGIWFNRFARNGILTRPFGFAPEWLRIGIPGEAWQWERVAETLNEYR